jgi:hypothetical protein
MNFSTHARSLATLLALFLVAGASLTGCDKSEDSSEPAAESKAADKSDESDKASDKEGAAAKEDKEPTLAKGEPVKEKGAAYFAVANYGLVELSPEGEFSKVGKKISMTTDMDTAADGTTYLAAVGGVYRAKEGKLETIGDYNSVGNVKRIAAGADGTVWGASFKGVHKWDGESWSTMPKADLGKEVKLIKDIAAGPDGQVIAASSNKLHVMKDGKWAVEDTSAIDAKPFFDEVAFGPDGTVFTTGNHGIAARTDGTWSVIDLKEDYVSATFLSVGADGTVHAAKRTGDVWAVSGGDVRKLDAKEKLGASSIHTVAGDGQGRTWIGTNNGIVIWKTDGSTVQWKPGTIDQLRGKVETITVTQGGPTMPDVGPQKKGSVTGKVLKDGAPMAGVQVEACESPATMFRTSPCNDKPVKFSGKTNDKGVFKFDEVPVGSYGFAIKPSPKDKWRVTLAFDCCAKLQDGKTYDVGSFDLSR